MANDNQPKANRLFTNWFLSLLSWGFPLVLAFFSTPVIVRGLGAENYGTYAVILGFLGYTFSTGIGKVAAKYIPEYRAQGEAGQLGEALSAAFWLALGVGVGEALILVFAAPFLVREILLIPADSAELVIKGFYIASLTGLVLMISQLFQFVVQGVHRFDIYAIITNVTGLISAAGSVLLVLIGYGITALLVWYGVVTTITGIGFFVKARGLVPEWKIGFSFTRKTAVQVAKYAGSIIVYQTLTNVLFAFERTWIVRKFGSEALAYYVVALMLALYIHGLLGSFVQVLFPAVNEMISDRERLTKIYLRATKVIFVVTAFLTATYIGSGETFLGLWIGEDFADRSYWLLVVLSIAFAVNVSSMVVWLLAETFRAPGLNALSSTLWTVVAIPTMVLAADWWQTEGVAVGRLVGVLLTVPLLFYIERRFLGRIHWQFWIGIVIRLIPAITALIVVEHFIFSREVRSWPLLFLGFAAGSGAYLLVVLFSSFFTRDELAVALSRLPTWKKQSAS